MNKMLLCCFILSAVPLFSGEIILSKGTEVKSRGSIITDSNGNVYSHFPKQHLDKEEDVAVVIVQMPQESSGIIWGAKPDDQKIDPIFLQEKHVSESGGVIGLNRFSLRLYSYPMREDALKAGEHLTVVTADKNMSTYKFYGTYDKDCTWKEIGTLRGMKIQAPALDKTEEALIYGASVLDENDEIVGNIYGHTEDGGQVIYWITPVIPSKMARIPLKKVGIPIYDLRQVWKKIRLTLFPKETLAFSPLIEPLFDDTADGQVNFDNFSKWVQGMIEAEPDRCTQYLPNLPRLKQDIEAGLRSSLYLENGRVSVLGTTAQASMVALINTGLPVIEEIVHAICDPYFAAIAAEKERVRLEKEEAFAAEAKRKTAEEDAKTPPWKKFLRNFSPILF